MKRLLHRAVLRTRAAPVLAPLWRGAYRAAASACAKALGTVPGVEAVYLHRGMTRPGWEPGISDIDLILVIAAVGAEAEGPVLEAIARRAGFLRAAFPMLGDLWIGTRVELDRYLERGGLRAWEDSPDWRLLAGRDAPRPALAESAFKRARLDPWVWAFTSYMELSRRLFKPGPELAEKSAADAEKMYLDACRYARAALEGRSPESRVDARRRASPGGRPLLELWLDAAGLLDEASRRVLSEAPMEGEAVVGLPQAAAGGPAEALRVATVVLDPPYHSYILAAPGDDLRRIARALGALPLPGVPLVATPAVWALALQSSYLGGPLGLLGGAAAPAAPAEGLFSGWGGSFSGARPGPVPLLARSLRREIAAEASSWMALWWRALWIGPGWPNRFVLFHLYSRMLGLSLALDAGEEAPFSDWDELLARARSAFARQEPFLESLERFAREESREALELPRTAFAAHRRAIAAWLGSQDPAPRLPVTRRFSFQGTSMLPLLRDGDEVLVREEPALKAGVLVARANLECEKPRLIVHRLVSLSPLVTRGDSCLENDAPASPTEIAGMVVAVRKRGGSLEWVGSTRWRLRDLACRLYARAAPSRPRH